METRTYNVYKFSELPEEAKEKALDRYRYFNVEVSYWYEDDEVYNEIAKDYGIEISMREIDFDLDRGSYVAFDTYNHSQDSKWTCPIVVTDEKKFCKKANVEYNPEYSINIDHTHYAGGRIANYIDSDYEEEEKLQATLEDMLDKLLKALKENYYNEISDEAIIDTLEANDYDFTIEGKID